MAMPAEHIVHSGIVETLVDTGSFDTLVEAIKKADLVEALSEEGPFTVFAPIDEAVARLPADFDERPDIACSNGIIHGIDRLLTPRAAAGIDRRRRRSLAPPDGGVAPPHPGRR